MRGGAVVLKGVFQKRNLSYFFLFEIFFFKIFDKKVNDIMKDVSGILGLVDNTFLFDNCEKEEVPLLFILVVDRLESVMNVVQEYCPNIKLRF